MTRLSTADVSRPERPLPCAAQSVQRWYVACLELAKARLSGLVVLTTAAGYLLAQPQPFDLLRFTWTLLGTMLAAWSANGLNQCIELPRDARMQRTAARPLVDGRLDRMAATLIAIVWGIIGLIVLFRLVSPLAAWLAAATHLLYVGVYTPLKPRTTLNTLIGAVVGAIPPMIGWVAASGSLSGGAWLLALVLFIWQVPHFLSLAWLYREDYERGGFRMLPAVDGSGRLTAVVVTLYSLALLPIGWAALLSGLVGWLAAAISALLALWLLVRSVDLWRLRSRHAARRLFLASIIYLPLLLGVMVLDARSTGHDAVDHVDARPVAPSLMIDSPDAPDDA
jgi:protoheme IX farnesyltransferase